MGRVLVRLRHVHDARLGRDPRDEVVVVRAQHLARVRIDLALRQNQFNFGPHFVQFHAASPGQTAAIATTAPAMHDVAVSADTTLDATLDASTGETFDCVVLPGGLPGATNLRDDERVQSLIRRQNEAGRQLAAICAAPIALGKAGVLEGRSATCYPGFEEELLGANPSEDRVVDDGNVVTSRGPGTVFDFSLALVAKLKDSETAEALRNGMLLTT